MKLDKPVKTALLLLFIGSVTETAVYGCSPSLSASPVHCISAPQDRVVGEHALPRSRTFTIRGKVVDAVTNKTLDFSELRIYRLLWNGKPSPYDNGIELSADRKHRGSFLGKNLRPGKYVISKTSLSWQIKKLAAYGDCEEFFTIIDASLAPRDQVKKSTDTSHVNLWVGPGEVRRSPKGQGPETIGEKRLTPSHHIFFRRLEYEKIHSSH